MILVVHLRAWSRGGYCEDHWLPEYELEARLARLEAQGYRVVEISRG